MKVHTGFTLIELMVTIAILAVLLGVGVPGFQETIRSNRVTSIANDLLGSMQFARSEAVRRGENIQVCSSADQMACGGAWADGWIVRNAAGPIRVWPGLRAGANVIPQVAGLIEFRPMGQVVAARCFDVSFDGAARNVDVGAAGRVRASSGACT